MHTRLLRAALALTLGLCACAAGMSSSAEMGATPGGIKDMKLARELVANGQVPPAEAFVVEGMFSEHDLPVFGPACAQTLCLRATTGIAPTTEGEPAGWVHVGLSSAIDPTAFQRPSLSLVLLVDTSGSMGWSYSSEQTDYGTPSAIARLMASEVVARLGAGDQVGLVTFADSADQKKGLTSASKQGELQGAIADIRGDGSTNLTDGYAKALALARKAQGATAQVRIMILTDAQPNTGGSDPASFEGMATTAAAEGISTTLVGIGLGLGTDVAKAMSHLHGGNSFSLMKKEEVATLLADEWPWMVSPIAYDLTLSLTPGPGMQLGATYGFPESIVPSAAMEASTVFLSNRRGALLVRLTPEQQSKLTGFSVTGSVSYRLPDGQTQESALDARLEGATPDAKGRFFKQAATEKTVALAQLVSGFKAAAETYASDPATAAAQAEKVVARFLEDAVALAATGSAADLDVEKAFAQDLLALMQSGAPQGTLYGQR